MTVSELIEKLVKTPPHAVVLVRSSTGQFDDVTKANLYPVGNNFVVTIA